MTIDERVDAVMKRIPYTNKAQYREALRQAMLEVARDQRHACAEAIIDVERCYGEHCGCKDAAIQAVMSAAVGKEGN